MLRICLAFLWAFACTSAAQAFCGFYVAKADGSLYNQSSKVVFVRDGNRSVITMSSDYRGAAKDFAIIVPTPKVLKREQVGTVEPETVTHLDSYTAPRLVEYNDYAPCDDSDYPEPVVVYEAARGGLFRGKQEPIYRRADALGVKIKGKFAVGTYDILILAAKQSDGLSEFLIGEGYKLPDGAEAVLGDYIKMGMKFFVAKVNLDRHKASEVKELPPLQISFRSRNFMLPIQLGKLNSSGTQDALFFMLTRKGRVEPSNYAAKLLPSNFNIPSFVEKDFGGFYKALFARARPSQGGIVTEYAWDMQWCDPCAADPLSREELEELGVHWLKGGDNPAKDVYVTRLHAQYSTGQMSKDIAFRVTNNRENFQGRYVMNHPFVGNVSCEAGKKYVQDLQLRLRKEAVQLSEVTGWASRDVERRVRASVPRGYW